MDSRLAILLVILGIEVMVDVKGQKLDDYFSQGEVTWASDCGGNGTLLKSIQLTGCHDGTCTLAISKSYTLSIPEFSPVNKNYTALTFVVSAIPSTLPNQGNITLSSNSMVGDFQANETYNVTDHILVDSKFTSTQVKDWTLRMEILGNDQETIICKTFPIKISDEFYGVECEPLYESCGLENSLCRPQNSHHVCQCDYSFVSTEDDTGKITCKGMAGTVCANSADCIQNAECIKYGSVKICDCKNGYVTESNDFTQCRSSASSIFYSFWFSTILAFLLLLRNYLK